MDSIDNFQLSFILHLLKSPRLLFYNFLIIAVSNLDILNDGQSCLLHDVSNIDFSCTGAGLVRRHVYCCGEQVNISHRKIQMTNKIIEKSCQMADSYILFTYSCLGFSPDVANQN